MKKEIWLMTQESKVDGDIFFNVIPCETEAAAKVEMEKKVRTLMNKSPYIEYTNRSLDFIVEKTKKSYYIEDICNPYYEYIRIEKKEIVTI